MTRKPVPIRVWFPYLIFVIRYSKCDEGFLYQGLADSGLSVYFRNSPLESFDDELFQSPTDLCRNGIVCTDHRFDRLVCETSAEIAGTVLDIWWNTVHEVYYAKCYDGDPNIGTWPKDSLEKVLKRKWEPVRGTLRCLVPLAADAEMVDEAPPEMPSRLFPKPLKKKEKKKKSKKRKK
jgi:hypothetical protein